MTRFYMVKANTCDGFIPCDNMLTAYRVAMDKFKTDLSVTRVTVWVCIGDLKNSYLYKTYSVEDYERSLFTRFA